MLPGCPHRRGPRSSWPALSRLLLFHLVACACRLPGAALPLSPVLSRATVRERRASLAVTPQRVSPPPAVDSKQRAARMPAAGRAEQSGSARDDVSLLAEEERQRSPAHLLRRHSQPPRLIPGRLRQRGPRARRERGHGRGDLRDARAPQEAAEKSERDPLTSYTPQGVHLLSLSARLFRQAPAPQGHVRCELSLLLQAPPPLREGRLGVLPRRREPRALSRERHDTPASLLHADAGRRLWGSNAHA